MRIWAIKFEAMNQTEVAIGGEVKQTMWTEDSFAQREVGLILILILILKLRLRLVRR